MLVPWKQSYDKPRQLIKKQNHHSTDKGPHSQSYGFSSRVWIWELDHKQGRAPKNWCFRTVVLEKTLESPLGSKEIKPVSSKGNKSWMFIGWTVAEAEAPVFDHLMWRTDSLERTLMLGKIEGRRRKGWQRMRWLDGITDSMDMTWVSSGSWWWGGRPGLLQSMVHEIAKSQTQLSDWTDWQQLQSQY